MKVGDYVTAVLPNNASNSGVGINVEGTVESVVEDLDTGKPRSVQVATQFGIRVWLDVEEHHVVASPDA